MDVAAGGLRRARCERAGLHRRLRFLPKHAGRLLTKDEAEVSGDSGITEDSFARRHNQIKASSNGK